MSETEDPASGSVGAQTDDLQLALQDLPLAQHVDRFAHIISDLTEQLRNDT
ncbi:hypothetical protein V5R04_05245 [Jonesiaceae bacterium BS-20]|uniref:Uncharacterized protein n=1 Tax=Jonesiaceae bacterium BS-20 TaxID=3120821 RepID=A0AAU7DZD3_9MICO